MGDTYAFAQHLHILAADPDNRFDGYYGPSADAAQPGKLFLRQSCLQPGKKDPDPYVLRNQILRKNISTILHVPFLQERE